MPIAQYCIFVVVDREFGTQISELSQRGPVWIVSTPINKVAAKEVWTQSPEIFSLEGVTIFDSSEDSTTENIFIKVLDSVDLHHGIYSANPPYTVIEAVGTPVTGGTTEVVPCHKTSPETHCRVNFVAFGRLVVDNEVVLWSFNSGLLRISTQYSSRTSSSISTGQSLL